MTLIHLAIMITSISLGAASFISAEQYFNIYLSILIGVVIFVFSLNLQYRWSCKFLHALFKAVDKGWVEKPDQDLFEKQIALHKGSHK